METSVPTVSIHVESLSDKSLKTSSDQMLTIRHCPNYPGECGELFLLATQERVPFEEGNHLMKEILSAPHNQHIRVVIRAFVILT
jgi:hypothetical protein